MLLHSRMRRFQTKYQAPLLRRRQSLLSEQQKPTDHFQEQLPAHKMDEERWSNTFKVDELFDGGGRKRQKTRSYLIDTSAETPVAMAMAGSTWNDQK